MIGLESFNKNNKKDDLADCFLQGIYYLVQKGNIKIYLITYYLKLKVLFLS